MMMINRHVVPAAALMVVSAAAALEPWTSAAAAGKPGAPPFCVMTGGRWGPGSVPQICRFYDYQQCLEAAAVLRGNCVVNIDYRGDAPMSPAPRAQRYRR